MRFILSADGGGSKLKMLLFNEHMELLAQGNAGGVNVNSTTAENARGNVVSCLRQVFASCKPPVIDKLYAVFVGPVEFLLEELGVFAEVREVVDLSEPAAAFYEATGKRTLLDIVCRQADNICACFGNGDGKVRGIPGHPEIELALLRLYKATGTERYRDTALKNYYRRECNGEIGH